MSPAWRYIGWRLGLTIIALLIAFAWGCGSITLEPPAALLSADGGTDSNASVDTGRLGAEVEAETGSAPVDAGGETCAQLCARVGAAHGDQLTCGVCP